MSELAPLSPRLSAILERARNHPPLPVAVVDAQEAHVLAGVVEESSNESLPEHIVRNGFLCPLPGGNRTRRRARRLTLLHVVEYFPEYRSNELIVPEDSQPRAYRKQEAYTLLEKFSADPGCADARRHHH